MNLSVCKSSECGSTVAMRTSAPEISQSQNSSSSSGQCFSNPSYHTVAQCNVVSTISSNLDGTLTLKVWTPSMSSHKISKLHAAVQNQHYIVFFFSQSNTLKSRNGSEWRAYCNLNDLGQFSSLPYYIAVRRSGIWTLQSQQFKGKRHTCRSHTPFIGANLLWMKMNQGSLVRHNLCSDFDKICSESSGAKMNRGHYELISPLSLPLVAHFSMKAYIGSNTTLT